MVVEVYVPYRVSFGLPAFLTHPIPSGGFSVIPMET
jgi:hypothetical protein